MALAGRLGGHSLDLALMQVSAATLGKLGLSVRDAFDPCRSLKAGAEVLRRSYRLSLPGQQPQRALCLALSRYNTGDPARAFRNGYVGRVERAASGAAGQLFEGRGWVRARQVTRRAGVPGPHGDGRRSLNWTAE